MRSSALPCGIPSMMSTRTTSHSSLATSQWAQVAPTLPAPTTVTLYRRGIASFLSHVVDDGLAELARTDQPGALHLALEVVGHRLRRDGPLHPFIDERGRLVPAHVLEHERGAEDER